jgi:hypothetical protein
MAKVQVKLGSAARKELFFALDSASTTGAGKTGASGTMAAYYVRNDTTPTATSIASPSFTEVSSANMPGVYYLTVPVGAFASGATTCAVMITGTGMAPVLMEYQLVAYDPDSSTNLGLSALPTASTGTAGGLITSGTGTAQLTTTSGVVTANTTQWNGTSVTGMPMPTYTQPTGFLSATFPTGTIANTTNITAATVTANTTQWGGVAVTGMPMPTFTYTAPPTAAQISTQVWTEPIPGTFAAGSAGAKLNSASSAGDPWSTAIPGSYAAGTAGNILGNRLDAAITTRMASFTYTAPPTVAQIWQTDVSGFSTVGQAGTYLKNAMPTFTYTAPLTSGQTASAVWDALLASYTGSTTFGGRIVRTLLASTTNEVSIGGSNHIAANVHAMQADVVTASALAADATAEIADRILGRTISGGADGGRTVTSALRILRNKFTAAATTLTVYAEDDATVAWTSTLSTDAAATPITGSDPA